MYLLSVLFLSEFIQNLFITLPLEKLRTLFVIGFDDFFLAWILQTFECVQISKQKAHQYAWHHIPRKNSCNIIEPSFVGVSQVVERAGASCTLFRYPWEST